MQRNTLSHKELISIMKNKEYKLTTVMNNREKLKGLIEAINHDEVICDDTIKIVRMLIRFYRFPILILFRPFYIRFQKSQGLYNLDQEIKVTGSVVLNTLKDLQKFPLLKFYIDGGWDERSLLDMPEYIELQVMKVIIKMASQVQQLIDSKIQDRAALNEIRSAKRRLNEYVERNRGVEAIRILCVEEYIRLLEQKEATLEQKLRPAKQPALVVNQVSDIYVESAQGKSIKINDLKVSQDFMCCRPYFYQNEVIQEPETATQEYKHYTYPYNRFLNQTLLKTIVGFLNGKGGIIYIGISQHNVTKKRLSKGCEYSEAKKQDVLKHFRQLGQRISPEIVNNQLYKLQYVPIKEVNGTFVPGRYIVRLKIQKGHLDELYCFKNYNHEELFAYRTANEVLLQPMGQKIIEFYRKKLNKKDDSTDELHEGPCKKPQLGRPIYDQHESHLYNNKNNGIKINKNINPPKPKEPSSQRQNEAFKRQHNFFIFHGNQLPAQMQQYVSHLQTKTTIIQAIDFNELIQIENIIKRVARPQQFQKCSLVINFQEEYFHESYKLLTNSKILFGTHKHSRKNFIFQGLKQLLRGVDMLKAKAIPFQYGFNER